MSADWVAKFRLRSQAAALLGLLNLKASTVWCQDSSACAFQLAPLLSQIKNTIPLFSAGNLQDDRDPACHVLFNNFTHPKTP
jgi:hypothetical protein